MGNGLIGKFAIHSKKLTPAYQSSSDKEGTLTVFYSHSFTLFVHFMLNLSHTINHTDSLFT